MSWSEWKLLKPTAANKCRTSEPKSFLVSPGLTDRDILETALPVFAPSCVTLDLRSCKDFDCVVNLRLMLESMHQNSPSASMDPDHRTRTCTLLVHGGVGVQPAMTGLTQASGSVSRSVKRGRDQATARGKQTSQGQNTDKLLTLTANDAVGRACGLLFERDKTDQSRHDYLPINKQRQVAVQTVIATGVVVDADATPELVTQKLKKYALLCNRLLFCLFLSLQQQVEAIGL